MTDTTDKTPIMVSYIYSHEDINLLESLRKQLHILKLNRDIIDWHDREISPGTPWERQILKQLEAADIILPLISSDLSASDFRWHKEVIPALERHNRGFARVIPVILRPCLWKVGPFKDLQAVPTDEKGVIKPITEWGNPDSAFENVADAIKKAVDELSARRRRTPPSPINEPTPRSIDHPEDRIFGRDAIAQQLIKKLRTARQPVVIKGFGGIGKSTVAELVSLRCTEQRLFDNIIQIDLRRYPSSAAGDDLLHEVFDIIVPKSNPNSNPTYEVDIDKKIETVIDLLLKNDRRYLLIFDNYESILHMEGNIQINVATKLAKFVNAVSKNVAILITSREDPNLDRQLVRELEPLNTDASRLFISQRLEDLDFKRTDQQISTIIEMSYGIPKVIKAVISLCKLQSVERVRQKLTKVNIPFEQSDKIYGDLFRESWNSLDDSAKKTLLAMVLFTGHASYNALKETAGIVDDQDFFNSVRKLDSMSLLDVRNRPDDTVYSIHPLTQNLCEAALKQDSEFESGASERFVKFYLAYCKDNYEKNPELVEREINNLMAAMRCAAGKGLWELLIEYRMPANQFLWKAGYWRQRAEADKLILEACFKLEKLELAAYVLVQDLGFTYLRFEDLDNADRYVRRGLEIFQKNNVQSGIALATRHLGKVALLKGEYEQPGKSWEYYFNESEQLYLQSLKIRESFEKSDPTQKVSIADLKLDFGRLYWLWGRKCTREGQMRQGMDLYIRAINVSEEAMSLFAQCGHEEDKHRGIAKAWGNIGNARKEKGRFYRSHNQPAEAVLEIEKAEQAYNESLRIADQIHKVDEIAHAQWGLGEIYEFYAEEFPLKAKDRLEKALDYAKQSHELYSRMATPYDQNVTEKLCDRIAKKLTKESSVEIQAKIVDFYPNRNSIPPFIELLNSCRQELKILGVTFSVIIHNHQNSFKDILHKGINVELLMMSPIDMRGHELPWVDEIGKVYNFDGFSDLLRANIKAIKSWRNQLEVSTRQNLKIKFYPTLPTTTMLIIDKQSEEGFIKLESLLFKFPPLSRPSYILKNKQSPDLFKCLVEMFEKLWNIGIDIDDRVFSRFLSQPK